MPKVSYLVVLRNTNFLKLWGSQIFSQVSIHMLNFVLIMRVFELTQTTIFVSFLLFCIGAPYVLFGIMGGSIVDRIYRRKLLLFSIIAQAGTIILYFFAFNYAGVLCLIAFTYNAINQLYIPAEGSMIPSLVKKKNLLTANSFFMFTIYGAYAGGFTLAGPLMQIFGSRFPFFLAFILLLLAAFSVFLLPSDKRKQIKINYSKIVGQAKKSIKEGIDFIRQKKEVLYPILSISVSYTAIAVLIVVIPAFTTKVLHIDVKASSYAIIGPATIGMLIGALIITPLAKKISKNSLITGGMLGGGIILILLSIFPYLGRFIKYTLLSGVNEIPLIAVINVFLTTTILAATLGFMNSLVVTPAQTMIQENAPARVRGRAFGSLNTLNNLIALFPMILAGFIADLFSVTTVLVCMGILLIAFGFKRMKHYQELAEEKP
ncbi:MFS transporter [Patescibacteria group bacterium]|nr:MAG: MFS transporter [Patescibacteria group bacterium]